MPQNFAGRFHRPGSYTKLSSSTLLALLIMLTMCSRWRAREIAGHFAPVIDVIHAGTHRGSILFALRGDLVMRDNDTTLSCRYHTVQCSK